MGLSCACYPKLDKSVQRPSCLSLVFLVRLDQATSHVDSRFVSRDTVVSRCFTKAFGETYQVSLCEIEEEKQRNKETKEEE